MKKLKMIIGIIALLYFAGNLVSCSAYYSCPTYANSKPVYRTRGINPVKPITYREYVPMAYKKVN